MTAQPGMVLGPDRELLKRAQSGEDRARDELARRHRKSAYLLALQLLGNREDALDVAQDAMLRFFVHIDRVDPQRPVAPWLLRIVRNRAIDLKRRRYARRAGVTDSLEEIEYQLVDRSRNPEREAVDAEMRSRLWRAVGRLPDAKREILVLRDFHDLSYAEIAETLEIPMGTVMSRLHAARLALRREFHSAAGEGSDAERHRSAGSSS